MPTAQPQVIEQPSVGMMLPGTPSWEASLQAIFTEIKQAVTGEAQEARDALQQVRTLVGEAIAGLNTSFEGLHTQSQQQASLVRALVESLATSTYIHDNSYLNIEDFVKKTTDVLKNYVHFAENISLQSQKTVLEIDEMVNHIDTISGVLSEVHLNTASSTPPASATSQDLARVTEATRRLAQHSRAFTEQIGVQVSKAQAMMTEINHLGTDDHGNDMTLAMAVKQRVDAILVELNTANLPLVQSLQEVSVLAEQIKGSVALAVRSLQFEDLVGQLLSYMETRLERIEEVVTTLHHSELHNTPDSVGVLHGLHTTLLTLQTSWQQHKSVLQDSMAEGEIELF